MKLLGNSEATEMTSPFFAILCSPCAFGGPQTIPTDDDVLEDGR